METKRKTSSSRIAVGRTGRIIPDRGLDENAFHHRNDLAKPSMANEKDRQRNGEAESPILGQPGLPLSEPHLATLIKAL
jgi:hypothetical protein